MPSWRTYYHMSQFILSFWVMLCYAVFCFGVAENTHVLSLLYMWLCGYVCPWKRPWLVMPLREKHSGYTDATHCSTLRSASLFFCTSLRTITFYSLGFRRNFDRPSIKANIMLCNLVLCQYLYYSTCVSLSMWENELLGVCLHSTNAFLVSYIFHIYF